MIYNYKWRAEKRADRGEVSRKLLAADSLFSFFSKSEDTASS